MVDNINIEYADEVSIRFSVYSKNSKACEKLLDKVIKILAKNNVSAEININRTYDNYANNLDLDAVNSKD